MPVDPHLCRADPNDMADPIILLMRGEARHLDKHPETAWVDEPAVGQGGEALQ
jgi:hypothetical protein